MAFVDDTGTPDFNTSSMETPPPESEPSEKSNKTFVRVAGGLGALILLSLLCFAFLALYWIPKQNANKDAQRSQIETQNAQMAMALTSTAEVSLWTPTSLPSPLPTDTVQPPTDTPVVAILPASPTVGVSLDQVQTATMAALNTQVALALLTPTSTSAAALAGTAAAGVTATALPAGGIGDQLSLSGMILAAVALVAVIFLARRMRAAPTR